ncbi:MAG: carboxypeptidase-like regulatory domain-containing protein, partial [Bacteroidota bacterium]
MENGIKDKYRSFSLIRKGWKLHLKGLLLLIVFICSISAFSQEMRTITGVVLDDQDEPVPGATVVAKDDPSRGTVTDGNGEFSLDIPEEEEVIVVSFVGMKSQEVDVSDQQEVTVSLTPETVELEETVVVGYGQQKKESVVGSITQTEGGKLKQSGGVSNIGGALTGNVPGVTTMSSTGLPGEEDPRIQIRGQSTWNNSDPLVLVDGIERSLSSVDIN